MNIEIILFAVFTMISAIGVSAINFNGIIKKNKSIEATILVVIITLSLGYLLTKIVIDFFSNTYI